MVLKKRKNNPNNLRKIKKQFITNTLAQIIMSETVKLEINDKNGYFYIEVNGKTEAKMTFVFAGSDKIIIDHTEVNEGNNGKGYGKIMVTKAVEFAREKNIKIIPLCPFAKSVIDKTFEFQDIL
jgi:predicted GNAT family acetyltransferase